MLAPLDDDGDHTWAVVFDDGQGNYYDVLDINGLYLDLDLDLDLDLNLQLELDAAESSIHEAKTFLDSASSVTRPDSLASSLPSAFLLSRSTSGATMKTSRGALGARSSNVNSGFLSVSVGSGLNSEDVRRLGSVVSSLGTSSIDNTPPLPPLPVSATGSTTTTTAAGRRVKPSKTLHLDLDHGRQPGRGQPDQIDEVVEEEHEHHLRLFEPYLLPEQRPMTARSQHSQTQHVSSPKGPVPNAARYIRVAPDGMSPPIAMTREDFEALPPTIQRKYFSTLERLRFAQDSCLAIRPEPASSTYQDSQPRPSSDNPEVYPGSSRFPTGLAVPTGPSHSHSRSHISASDLHFYANLPEKIKRRHLTEEEQLAAQRHRQSVILDAADEALIKASRRHSQLLDLDAEASTTPTQRQPQFAGDLRDYEEEYQDGDEEQFYSRYRESNQEMDGSLYESFRWLEEEEELDLRLYLDDYHINLRQEVPLLSNTHRPTFRRHLSVSKLPFGRNSTSGPSPTQARDAPTSPITADGPSRRRSRALSLISPSKQPLTIETPPLFDPATAYYQDPEARMKLRVYLASPQKFDEAIEFGFPSMDDVHGAQDVQDKRSKSRQANDSDNCGTFLEDGDDEDGDDASSAFTDGVSLNDPDSPRTPDLADKPPTLRPSKVSQDLASTSRSDYAQAPASSREMTLRMTLTRPDLRANDEQIYGWQQRGAVVRKPQTWEGARASMVMGGPGPHGQSFDRYHDLDEPGHSGICDAKVVKRIWNRVRRV